VAAAEDGRLQLLQAASQNIQLDFFDSTSSAYWKHEEEFFFRFPI